jgi:hypothetical protein
MEWQVTNKGLKQINDDRLEEELRALEEAESAAAAAAAKRGEVS